MIFKFNFHKTAAVFLIGTLLGPMQVNSKPVAEDVLPDMGITSGTTLSISQEKEMGDFYLRQMRAQAPLIFDPLLNEYINVLGEKLVSHAKSVKMPFHFYLLNNTQINAFAFFGAHVFINLGLFLDTDNESELAAVLAHEISHVTQRHLARNIEKNERRSHLTLASTFGSLLLALANPQAGIMALTSSLGFSQQQMLSLSQSNEQEADRVGLELLQASGFNAQAMTDFLEKLADKSRFSTHPPEMLLTHPLPESRLSDIRNRVSRTTAHSVTSSPDYLFAKARLQAMFSTNPSFDHQKLNQITKNSSQVHLAKEYGQSILLYQNKKYDKARQLLEPLLTQYPNNIWFIDLITDIDLAQNQAHQAIARLQKAGVNTKHQRVAQLNLANAYIKAGLATKAVHLLRRYTFEHPNDMNGWDLLIKSTLAGGWRDQALAARAENFVLRGNFSQAIKLLSHASTLVPVRSLEQLRYDARIDQLRKLAQSFKKYQK